MFNRLSRPSWVHVTFLLLCAQFLFGFAIIAMLPPFEGFDETAHFSRIQSQNLELSPTAAAPGSDLAGTLNHRITMEIFDYYRRGPMPYHWIDIGSLHEDDPYKNYLNYDVFSKKPRQLHESYMNAYRKGPLPEVYNPSAETNWEYQQPGLYYAAMEPVITLLAGRVSLISVLLILRSFSFLLAFAGFCIGLFATKSYFKKTSSTDAGLVTALGALYPFLIPEYFWEFARLGSDSLYLFLFSILWALLLWFIRPASGKVWLYLSLLLGLGLGAINFTSSLLANDIVNPLQQNFSVHEILNLFQSFVWIFGSWSHIVLQTHTHILLCLFTAIIFFAYLLALQSKPNKALRLPLWIGAPLFLALAVTIGMQGSDTVHGGYLHVIAPCIALIYGLGLTTLGGKTMPRILLTFICLPIIAFNFFIAWSYATIFSGCAVPVRNDNLYFLNPVDAFGCTHSFATMLVHLRLMAWPDFAVASFVAAFILLILAGFLALLFMLRKKGVERAS